MSKLTADQVIQVIGALVGAIGPVGDTSIDANRLDNLDVYCDVFERMSGNLKSVADDHENKLHSISVAGKRARKTIDAVHFDLGDSLNGGES